jgi:beta-xylosidase
MICIIKINKIMKRYYFLLLALILPLVSCSSASVEKDVQHLSSVPLADPFILLDDGVYYAYGTHSDYGIEVYTSTDLKTWKSQGLALSRENTTETQWFWAPEVYKIGSKYYMYYSANEHLYVATADSPKGPFKQVGKAPMMEEKSIDSSLFVDEDGTPYLFFVRFNDGNNVWVAQLNNDYVTLKTETLHPCIHVSQSWEQHQVPEGRVNEGPCVIKHNGTYYMTYSANHYMSQNYGVGVATAQHIMGDWTKSAGNPILQRVGGLYGTGHNSMFTDKEGNLKIVFHAHHDASSIHPRLMYIGDASFVKGAGSIDDLKIGTTIIIPQL